MKKILTFAAVIAIAATMQAATLQWGIGTELAASLNDDGEGWAQAGTYAALIYLGKGVNASSYQVAWDKATSSWSVSTDGSTWSAANVIDSYIYTSDDYDKGYFSKSITGVGTSFQDETYSSWEELNTMGLIMVMVTDPNGSVDFATLSDANKYGIYAGRPTKFSTQSGDYGTGFFMTDSIDASGAGSVPIVPIPEPATGMLALAGVMMLVRRKRA